jgi:hypothetical protein
MESCKKICTKSYWETMAAVGVDMVFVWISIWAIQISVLEFPVFSFVYISCRIYRTDLRA